MTKFDLVIHVNICKPASGDDTSFNIWHAAANKVQTFLSELIRITDFIQKYFHTISLKFDVLSVHMERLLHILLRTLPYMVQ